jgi:D-serine deaminase-like pyridoxal phosphate-dependent protein
MVAPSSRYDRLERATTGLDAPFGVVDLQGFRANAADLVQRAGGLLIRVASKAVRCRTLLAEVLQTPGFRGVMAYSLREALWLSGHGVGDILVAYPSVDRAALRRLIDDPVAADRITVMVDDVAHLDWIRAQRAHRGRRAGAAAPVQVCLDVDASLRIGPLHLGVRRSPLRTPREVQALAEEAARRDDVLVTGLMFYDAQIARLPDASPLARWVK